MILGEVEETLTTVEIDDETYEEIIKVRCRRVYVSARYWRACLIILPKPWALAHAAIVVNICQVRGLNAVVHAAQVRRATNPRCTFRAGMLLFAALYHQVLYGSTRAVAPGVRCCAPAATLQSCSCHQAFVHMPDRSRYRFCLLQTNKRVIPYLFVRGDGVILVSPPLRT